MSDVLFRWHSLLPVEVGVGISFASEIMVIWNWNVLIVRSSGLTDTTRLTEAYGKNGMLSRLGVLVAVLMGI